MKSMMALLWAFLLCGVANAAVSHGLSLEPMSEGEVKEEVAEEAAEKADTGNEELPSLDTLRIKFEIKNFNYYDLTKETCPEKVIKVKKVKPQACTCLPSWTSNEDGKKCKKEHNGCPSAPCDGDKKGSWCIVANPGCKTEEKGSWSYCKVAKVSNASHSPPTMADAAPKPSESPKKQDTPPAVPEISESESSKLPWMRKKEKTALPPPPPPAAPPAAPAMEGVHGASDKIENAVKGAFGMGGAGDHRPPWMQKKEKGTVLLQLPSGACAVRQDMGETKSTECSTVMDVLRTAIKETVSGIIRCLYLDSIKPKVAAPAKETKEKPAMPEKEKGSFLSIKPSGPAPAPAGAAPAPAEAPPPMPDVKIFVTFSPGRKIGRGASTMVEVTFIDTPKNGVDDVKAAEPFLQTCFNNGMLEAQIGDALEQVTNIPPEVADEKMSTEKVTQWNIKKCEKHLRSVVNDFSLYYTRRQVPMALYNECTNFMTKMSFSHDHVLDRFDTIRCKKATRKFATHWNYGKKAEDKDFHEMCLNACEAKYGRNAPTCNVKMGDNLKELPKLL